MSIPTTKGDATANGHYYYSLRFSHDTGIVWGSPSPSNVVPPAVIQRTVCLRSQL
jgi:hypothetical protein